VLEDGIPDDAYKAVEGDDKAAAREYRKRNKAERESGQMRLAATAPLEKVADELAALSHEDERTPEDVERKERRYDELRQRREWQLRQNACDAWTAAFFTPLKLPEYAGQELVPTTATVWTLRAGGQAYGKLTQTIAKAAGDFAFFHWPVEFPDVFARRGGGFDVVLGNPPWERIKLQEKEFFASREPAIASAANKAAREKLIKELPRRRPELGTEWVAAVHGAEAQSKFVRASQRFPLCGRGDVNTYSIFAELARGLAGKRGRAGIVIPSGIATDDTTKFFFRVLVESGALVSLFDFQSSPGLFMEIGHARFKFCLLTTSGVVRPGESALFAFFTRSIDELRNPERQISLSPEDIALLNPNTRTCPIFRTKRDAEITKAIYRRVPVLIKEGPPEENPWGVHFLRMFDMSNDSHLFRTREQLEREGWRLDGNIFVKGDERYLPLYEAKMIHQFNHRFGDYRDKVDGSESTALPNIPPERLSNPAYSVFPRYWVPEGEVSAALAGKWDHDWLLGWRDICRSTDERTVIASVIPRVGVGHTMPLLLIDQSVNIFHLAALSANLGAFVFDFAARQKIGGTHLTYMYLNQLPICSPFSYDRSSEWLSGKVAVWISERVSELTFSSFEIGPSVNDLGYDDLPFRWDEERRFLIRCELDAAFFHLYGISRDDTDYIMETFPIVKRKDEQRFSEYRTKRVILEIYDAMDEAKRTGHPYQTRLDPPPGDPRAAHQIVSEAKGENTDVI
jgi:hypothetical protein